MPLLIGGGLERFVAASSLVLLSAAEVAVMPAAACVGFRFVRDDGFFRPIDCQLTSICKRLVQHARNDW